MQASQGRELGFLLLALAGAGLAFAMLVLRADPRRWDNRIFSAMCFVDGMMEALRAAQLLDGGSITGEGLQLACMLGSVLISYLTIEFVYSFPFNRRLPTKNRFVLTVASLVAVALTLHPQTRQQFRLYSNLFYFLPIFAVTIYHLVDNYRRLSGNREYAGIGMIMLAVGLRWTSSMAVYMVARRISQEAFSIGLHLDALVSVTVCYVLCSRAILQYQLFRVRGMLADVIVYGGFTLSVTGLLYIAVQLVLTYATGPVQLRAMLVALAMVPLALASGARWIFPAFEEKVLCPLDPRRARIKSALAKLVHEASSTLHPRDILGAARSAVESITSGGTVQFLRGPGYPSEKSSAPASDPSLPHDLLPALVEYFLSSRALHLHRPHAHELSPSGKEALDRTRGDLFVPVRHEGTLFGALAIEGGDVDREAVQTVVAVADHVALKLENYALFGEMLALENQLEETRRLAALGSFAAAIAHDIRTPLTSVQMNVQILRSKSKLDPDDMEYFDIALAELKRLAAHISELLDYAKPVQMKPAPTDVCELIDDAAKGIEPILSDRRLSLERDLERPLPPVLADPTRIRQVLLNLLDNAAQASNDGASIKLRTRAIGSSKVALEVSDQGRGIDAEHLPKIFEPFFTTRPDGTGLGLAIAQKLVRAHGGEIKVESTVGGGSTFTILLPTA
jgi:signal transduction histidine kinase